MQLLWEHVGCMHEAPPLCAPALAPSRCLQIAPEKHKPGMVVHAVGHPRPWNVYGGSFIYHRPDNKVALG
jgi:flavin-dependent dehydrogenase